MPASASPLVMSDRSALSRSGLLYRTRPVRRSDEAALRDMFLRCSADDLRLRCFGISKTFPGVFAAHLARLSGPDEFAIVAVLESGEIGGVVHAVGVGSAEADYDIMVRTDLKGQGIGTRLMREMLTEAGRSGFQAVHGDVMLGNRAMLLLAGDLGFRRVATDGGVVRIRATPQRPGPAAAAAA
ncbi:GNAT family N-acetyltransferase [Lichenibacterium ramalinae]|uniref:GNAT family N-acetyltransferase n=1 Tax=Lichenibacterium ramalinae TaxID=2316527 RepID=A0A4Q2RAP0_9HYPH|nr:GNAT family N-acetyltransferase [Lichenibacterium ramalinae]RYB02696.1 GNAT family N-acetyltransferase [Lichenibacterium ramalinae]